MKIEHLHTVSYLEVDPNFNITIKNLIKDIQASAITHSEKVGFGSQSIIQNQKAWVLNKIGIDILRLPTYQEQIRCITWHRESKGVRSYREFEAYSGNEKIVSATSLWLFIDLQNRKILRVPKNTGDLYGCCDETSMPLDIDSLKTDVHFSPHFSVSITTRPSDYDPLGHVNNAAYFDYADTLFSSYLNAAPNFKIINLQFLKEINTDIKKISAGLQKSAAGFIFKLYDDEDIFAAGNVNF